MAEDEMPDVDEEIDVEIDAALMESLLEREEMVGHGKDIEKDLEEIGPLARYVTERRAEAVTAFKAFPDLDVENHEAIRNCQNAVRLYLHVLLWVGEQFKTAAQAETEIRRELFPGETARDD